MNKITTILLFFFFTVMVLAGCSVNSAKYYKDVTAYTTKLAPQIQAMAEQAMLYARANNIHSFQTADIADRKMRKKMKQLGAEVDITYSFPSAGDFYDSTVIFKSISIMSGVHEYIYDFATHPKNYGTNIETNSNNAVIQVSERVYYRRRPFPMM